MKQITRFFLFLTLIALLQSCNNEDMQDEVLNTTSVSITTHNAFLSGKNVNDPSIFGNIRDITVTARHIASGYEANTLFTISNNSNDPTNYVIDNVQVGMNDFTATATTATIAIAPSFSSTPRNNSNSGIWNTISTQVAAPPYATYSGSVSSIAIDHINPITLNIPMNTSNGRFIAYFRGGTKTNFSTTVTPYINEVAQPPITMIYGNDFYLIWNDSDCVEGKTIRFECITTNKGNSTKSTANIPNVTIKSHTTSKYAYDIPETGNTYTAIPHN